MRPLDPFLFSSAPFYGMVFKAIQSFKLHRKERSPTPVEDQALTNCANPWEHLLPTTKCHILFSVQSKVSLSENNDDSTIYFLLIHLSASVDLLDA